MDMQQVIDLSLPILKHYRVKKAALFGSLVRGTAKPDSDIDMLIDPPEYFSLFDLAGLKVKLEETLNREVDVVEYRSIKPILRDSILKHEYPFL